MEKLLSKQMKLISLEKAQIKDLSQVKSHIRRQENLDLS